MANKIIQLSDGTNNLYPERPKNVASLVKSTSEAITITPSTGSNYSGYGNSYYYKEGTKVHVHLGLQGLSTNWTGNSIITLPTGYRPRSQLAFVGVGGSVSAISTCLISPSGAVNVYGSTQYSSVDCEYDVFG